MWQIKRFKTVTAMRQWVELNDGRVQWHEVFINNGYAVEYRRLREL